MTVSRRKLNIAAIDEPNDEIEPPTTEDDASQTTSPFKKPPDSVSVDGSTSAKFESREQSRERHMSINSTEGSESRMSETESERRQSANEELAAQYAQQLAFYR